jgi:hypothetical protein
MATSGEKRWPPVGNFVAASGEKPMAIDNRVEPMMRPAQRVVPEVRRTAAEIMRETLRGRLLDQVGAAELDLPTSCRVSGTARCLPGSVSYGRQAEDSRSVSESKTTNVARV